MKAEFSGSVAKDLDSPESNEDKFAFSENGRCFALSDGASESFDSKRWAEIIAEHFARTPKIDEEWMAATLRDYAAAHDFASMSWSRQAAFERGSFATLLGVEDDKPRNSVDILAIGDSVALLVSGGKLIKSWPFSDPEKFLERPTLLSTLPHHNRLFLQSGFWSQHGTTFQLDGLDKPRLICMTDALGEWALRQIVEAGKGLEELLSISTLDELTQLVVRERAVKRMRIDDSTLIVISFEREAGDGLPNA